MTLMGIIGFMILVMAMGRRSKHMTRGKIITIVLIALAQVALVLIDVFTASPPSGS